MKNNLLIHSFIQAFALVIAASKPSAVNETDVLFSKTVSSIHSALRFFERNYKNVNLDSIIGTRILEGMFVNVIYIVK